MKNQESAEQIRDFSYRIKNTVMHAVSGDDIYLVTQDGDQFVFAKYLYGGDSAKNGIEATHYLSETAVFDKRGEACVHLSQKLLAEETGYAEGDA